MAKGAIAKEKVLKKIINALGSDYIGEFDKKYFCWADDGGERVQVSIALTCPKVYRGVEETGEAVLNFDEPAAADAPAGFKLAEITKEEEETLADLIAKFGL